MATTRNGWPKAPAVRTAITAPGCADTGEVRAGDVAVVMQAFTVAFDAEVEPLSTINGYRSPELNAAAGGDAQSNHMSGTALDLNGARHPYERNLPAPQQGKAYKHGFTDKQVAKIREILARFDGVVRWGLDFNPGYRDAMHFEIHGTPAQVAAAAAALRAVATSPTSEGDDDMYTEQDRYAAGLLLASQGRVEQNLAAVSRVVDAIAKGQEAAQADLDRIEWGVLDEGQGVRAMIARVQASVALLGAQAADPATSTTSGEASEALLEAIHALPAEIVDELRDRLAG